MSHHIQAGLKARRTALIAEARQVMEKRPMNQACSRRFDELMNEVDDLQAQIQLGERVGGMAGREDILIFAQASRDRQDPTTRAFSNYLKHGMDGLDHEDRAVAIRHFQQPNIQNAQGVGTGSGGGFLVPDAPMGQLVEAMKLIGGLLPHATIIPSETGAALPIPTTDERNQKGEIIAENAQHSEQDITLASVVLDTFMYSSKIVRVSIQLMDDAAFPFDSFVMKLLGERIGRATSEHFVTGDGSSKPRGIVTAAPVGKTAASPTAIVFDELVDLLHSVDPFYRTSGVWIMNDVVFGNLRKIKDSQNRPLFVSEGLVAGAPTQLLGHPVSIDNNMPAQTTGLKPIIFGDLKSYYIRIVKDVRVLRLQERYAEFGQLGFLGFLRCDADLVDGGGGAVKALQMA